MSVTILGLEHGWGRCFREIGDAVAALATVPVYFMTHYCDLPRNVPLPRNAVAYHWENGPLTRAPNVHRIPEIWDFSSRNVSQYPVGLRAKVQHVPCGYHPSMERFTPAKEPSFDVVWVGAMHPRRRRILDQLRVAGLRVADVGDAHGTERDGIIARSAVLLNMLYYETGVFSVLRSAHAIANRIPTVAEAAPEIPAWAALEQCSYNELVPKTIALARAGREHRRAHAERAYEMFRASPLILPPPLELPLPLPLVPGRQVPRRQVPSRQLQGTWRRVVDKG